MPLLNFLKFKHKSYLILFLSLLIFAEIGLYYAVINKNAIAQEEDSKVGQRLLLEEEIKKEGAEKVFQKLSHHDSSGDIGSTHLSLHLFGEVLYKLEGLPSLTVCDSSFGFGCYHGFFLAAISSEGIDAVKKADMECVKKWGKLGLGCQHGIGHGIMEYYGGQIEKALDACGVTSWKGSLLGCRDGVMMEYNLPTLISDEKSENSAREIKDDNLYEPCPGLPSKHQLTCYFSLGEWWYATGIGFKNMGELCSEISNLEHKKICYLGIGRAISARVDFDLPSAINECSLIEDDNSEAICRAGLKWEFYANPEMVNIYPKICEGLAPAGRNICEENWNIVEVYKNG